jgi:CheY-like chemotaxis protein
MTEYRVLIVDDHREIRESYRANLEILEVDLDVLDVPSGEEAILEATLNQIDLLIADVQLPGMTGLELLEKMKASNPDLKVILVTGLLDIKIRRKVSDADADAFFLKPVEIPDLQNAVEICLGLAQGEEQGMSDMSLLEEEEPQESVSDRLTSLRHQLNAFSTILLDDHGKVLAQAGGMPDAVDYSEVLPVLMATFSVVNKVSLFLGKSLPEDLWYFSGEKYDLFWTHVGFSHGLLVASNPIPDEMGVAQAISLLRDAEQDLIQILQRMGILSMEQVEERKEEVQAELFELDPEDEDELMDILQAQQEVATDELDEYWDHAASEKESGEMQNPDSLSFDQAKKLGLTPEDDE